jgi:hypothetical protein
MKVRELEAERVYLVSDALAEMEAEELKCQQHTSHRDFSSSPSYSHSEH